MNPLFHDRVRGLNQAPLRPHAQYVLYWSQMNRRVSGNHALAHAISLANSLKLPLLVYEALTCTYRQANRRLHTFILEGVPETAKRLAALGAGYVFYLRARKSDSNNTLYRLAENAAALITDDYPTFIAAQHNSSVPAKLSIPYLAVDSSCVIPMNRFEKREYAAYTIRPKVHRLLPEYLKPWDMPVLRQRWNLPLPAFHTEVTAGNIDALVASCEIDHSVAPSLTFRGGALEAEKRLAVFLDRNLRRYSTDRNHPAAHATSNLSPYLHFGMISALDVALAVERHGLENNLSSAEFLEEMIVRRELAFNFARYAGRQTECLSSLPDWARRTLLAHATDERKPCYSREQFERALTHDDIWNATQKELLLRGKMHGYYRMYWGKKIIEWSPTCQDALETMIYLHDKYALDGRDPNTYTGILWCFGLHDRPWGERSIFGQIRYMSYDGMKRKTDSAAYLREIAWLESTGREPHPLQ
ncbi:MAG: deoxyribodipyrimidine photo-lyase [Acidobacteriota bacterium]